MRPVVLPSQASQRSNACAGSTCECVFPISSTHFSCLHPTLPHPSLPFPTRAGTQEIPVVTGFLARAKSTGAVATLGRGGSDLTATVLGRALGVKEVQVWKDVDGVLTADPRVVQSAIPVPFLTYEEATELAYFGAQVLHPQAMRPAIESRGELNVRVKNSYNIRAHPRLPTTLYPTADSTAYPTAHTLTITSRARTVCMREEVGGVSLSHSLATGCAINARRAMP